jgi:hypothetical protein
MARVPACLAIVTVIAVAGCGQIAFKRGSGTDALMADRASCREQNPYPAAVRACMAQHGWHITDLNGEPAPAPAYPALVAAQQAPDIAPSMPTPPGAPPPAPELQPLRGSDKIRVGSWWHVGGGAGDLHAAVDGCVSKLGPADQPDAGYHTVTRALYSCLAAQGWRKFGSPPA